MSVNQKRMKRMLRSATSAFTSSAVWGASAIPADLRRWPALTAIDGWPNRRPSAAASVAGDGRDEISDLFCFLALEEQRRHLPETAGATFGDRAQHKRLPPGRGGDVIADA